MSYILGIDPGISGGLCFIDEQTGAYLVVGVKKSTPADIVEFLEREHIDTISMAYLERVHSMPKQGVRSVFTFGTNFGTYIGILAALKIPTTYVNPGVWQRVMGCLTKGDKNVSKRRAQELFPKIKMTHAIADAMLIAEYGRRDRAKHQIDPAFDL